jgi:8-oxo-dGTP pyrophosphatase MutT (NUDIX family)
MRCRYSGAAAPLYRRPMTGEEGAADPTVWRVHDEWLVDDTRRLNLRLAHVELPDGGRFEQYVLRMPKAAMTVVLDDAAEHTLLIWRHRFVMDRWTWELPGGYVEPDEDPAVTAAREVEEETGWRPRSVRPLVVFQPLVGTADFENLVFLAEGAEDTGKAADVNEAARVEWMALDSIRDRIAAGEIIGAGTQIGLLHVLAFHRR